MYRWAPVPEVAPERLDELGLGRAWEHQSAAEEWLTGAYPDLLEAGITAVTLLEENRPVYGPMGLEA